MKVRASAGSSSLRRRARLEAFKKIAREQVELLKQEMEDNSGAASKREQSERSEALRGHGWMVAGCKLANAG
jgi:hypothetical protein